MLGRQHQNYNIYVRECQKGEPDPDFWGVFLERILTDSHPASDQYSLGFVVYESAMGERDGLVPNAKWEREYEL